MLNKLNVAKFIFESQYKLCKIRYKEKKAQSENLGDLIQGNHILKKNHSGARANAQ